MENQYFFGYGSLVNRSTHGYPNCSKATVTGWRRAWVSTGERPFAYLSAIRSPGNEIAGLIAKVPGGDWAALDEREAAYDRVDATDQADHTNTYVDSVAIYSVPNAVKARQPILLSYLDVVLQGYLTEFGENAAQQFVETTDGWQAPICNDRATPIYPRHQSLTAQETACVDDLLARIGGKFVQP